MSTRSLDEIERRERSILGRCPFQANHVPNSECHDYDARLTASFVGTERIRIIGAVRIDAGTVLELKTCQVWIDDNGSRNGRRRGTFRIQKGTHERLEAVGGVYCLLVMDGEKILAGRIMKPEQLGLLVSSWTNGGSKYKSARAHVSWGSIFPKEEVEES